LPEQPHRGNHPKNPPPARCADGELTRNLRERVAPETSDETELVPPESTPHRLTKIWRDDLRVIHDHRAAVPTAGRDRARPSKSAKLPYPVLTRRRAERARSLVARKRRRLRIGTRNGFQPQTARPGLTKFWRDELRVIPLLRQSRPYPVRFDPAQAFSIKAITSASISP
jgi:hypothetical protein